MSHDHPSHAASSPAWKKFAPQRMQMWIWTPFHVCANIFTLTQRGQKIWASLGLMPPCYGTYGEAEARADATDRATPAAPTPATLRPTGEAPLPREPEETGRLRIMPVNRQSVRRKAAQPRPFALHRLHVPVHRLA